MPGARQAAGAAYERYMGRWSARVAGRFLRWLDPSPGLAWLDVGCGTGALTRAILASDRAAPSLVWGLDPSDALLAHARGTTDDPRVRFDRRSAEDLGFDDERFDVVVSGLVLNWVTDASRALSEMERVCRRGGTVAAYVWDYQGEMQFLRHFWEAVLAVVPGGEHLERFPMTRPDPLRSLFEGAGLRHVRVDPVEIETPFEDFADYWAPFEAGFGPAPSYAASLDEERRSVLRDHLERTLPRKDDGSIRLVARAWAVRGSPGS